MVVCEDCVRRRWEEGGGVVWCGMRIDVESEPSSRKLGR